jgi:hypothetical protein
MQHRLRIWNIQGLARSKKYAAGSLAMDTAAVVQARARGLSDCPRLKNDSLPGGQIALLSCSPSTPLAAALPSFA